MIFHVHENSKFLFCFTNIIFLKEHITKLCLQAVDREKKGKKGKKSGKKKKKKGKKSGKKGKKGKKKEKDLTPDR